MNFRVVLLAAVVGLSGRAAARPGDELPGDLKRFAAGVDLGALRLLAVQNDGRVKNLDTLARETMRAIYGGGRVMGLDPLFVFFDLAIDDRAWQERPIIRIKKSVVRKRLLERLQDMLTPEQREWLEGDGRVSPAFLGEASVTAIITELQQDILRTERAVRPVIIAMNLARSEALQRMLRIVPPTDGRGGRWMPAAEAFGHANWAPEQVGGGSADKIAEVGRRFMTLGQAWQQRDVRRVNELIPKLAAGLAGLSPQVYPSLQKRRVELRYYGLGKFIWAWVLYVGAIPPLLMGLVRRSRRGRQLGLALMGLAFVFHGGSLAVRWALSGRIPIANQFESMASSALFATVVALGLELWRRRSVFALGAAVYSGTVLLIGQAAGEVVGTDIKSVAPILHDTWLYIHTNIIILSYGIIAIACVAAVMQLGNMAALRLRGRSSNTELTAALDASTMILLQLAFIILWVGIITGAIWADHSWGRPWGWDPKEVFALETWIVFLILLHVRLKVRAKAFWTAVLCTAGATVMTFNWIVVNYFLVGLHSYA